MPYRFQPCAAWPIQMLRCTQDTTLLSPDDHPPPEPIEQQWSRTVPCRARRSPDIAWRCAAWLARDRPASGLEMARAALALSLALVWWLSFEFAGREADQACVEHDVVDGRGKSAVRARP
jgi:hypothetical protein